MYNRKHTKTKNEEFKFRRKNGGKKEIESSSSELMHTCLYFFNASIFSRIQKSERETVQWNKTTVQKSNSNTFLYVCYIAFHYIYCPFHFWYAKMWIFLNIEVYQETVTWKLPLPKRITIDELNERKCKNFTREIYTINGNSIPTNIGKKYHCCQLHSYEHTHLHISVRI